MRAFSHVSGHNDTISWLQLFVLVVFEYQCATVSKIQNFMCDQLYGDISCANELYKWRVPFHLYSVPDFAYLACVASEMRSSPAHQVFYIVPSTQIPHTDTDYTTIDCLYLLLHVFSHTGTSPYVRSGLAPGNYALQVQPSLGQNCRRRFRRTINFTVW